MNAIELPLAVDLTKEETSTKKLTIAEKFNAFAASQADKRTAWFCISILAQGVLFLPLPAFLMYYYNAPIVALATTLVLFFANIIAGMGGSKIGTLIILLALSVVVHIAMIVLCVL
jgi:hypothetical protein